VVGSGGAVSGWRAPMVADELAFLVHFDILVDQGELPFGELANGLEPFGWCEELLELRLRGFEERGLVRLDDDFATGAPLVVRATEGGGAAARGCELISLVKDPWRSSRLPAGAGRGVRGGAQEPAAPEGERDGEP
jgi:hypothetical protein